MEHTTYSTTSESAAHTPVSFAATTLSSSDAGGFISRDGNKYHPYTAEFTDEDNAECRYVFHFRRLQRAHMVMIAKAGKDKSYDSQKEVLAQLVLPEEREQLQTALENHIGLVGSFTDEVFTRAGAGSVFRGK